MKRQCLKKISKYLIRILLTATILFILSAITVAIIFVCMIKPDEELLFESTSPDSSISLEVYRINGGATVDFSIEVYMKKGSRKKLIYNEYHEMDADVEWLSNDVVQINNIRLDLSKKQTYDWRKGVRPK